MNNKMVKTKTEGNEVEKEAEFHARQSGRRVFASVTTDNVRPTKHIHSCFKLNYIMPDDMT
jgi:hypothetical protein